jgi:hypothetical protein
VIPAVKCPTPSKTRARRLEPPASPVPIASACFVSATVRLTPSTAARLPTVDFPIGTTLELAPPMDLTPTSYWLSRLLDAPDAEARAASVLTASAGPGPLLRCPAQAWVGPGWLSATEAERLDAARHLCTHLLCATPGPHITTPAQVLGRFGDLVESAVEQVWLLAVDPGLRPLARRLVAQGGRAACALDCADILRPVLLHGACGLFLVHNHPSGDPTPSENDRKFTARIMRAAATLDLQVHDHLVLAGRRWASCVTRASGTLNLQLKGAA